MKTKRIIYILIFLISSAAIHSQSSKELNPISLSFEPEFGFLTGKIVENVWNVTSRISSSFVTLTPTTKLSRLDWQIKNNMYSGLKIELKIYEKLYLGFGFKEGFKGICGVMEDYDWKSPDPEHLTNYSWHKNELNTFTQLDLLSGRIFSLETKLPVTLIPQLGIHIEKIGFTGIGGYKTYENENWKYVAFSDSPIIQYSQQVLALSFKLRTNVDFFNFAGLRFDIALDFVPSINALDSHVGKSAYYNDRIKDACLLQSELFLYGKIGKSHRIGIKGSVEYIPDAYGFTYYSNQSIKDLSDTPDSSNLGGTSRLMFTYALVYQFIF